MESFGRQPPRYVPTLTDVVAEGLPISRPAEGTAHASQHMAVQDVTPPAPQFTPSSMPSPAEPEALASGMLDAAQLHAEVVARLLERIQPMLETQLRDAVAEVVQSHTEVLARSLRVVAEDVVRAAVADAVVQEYSAVLQSPPLRRC